MLFAVTGVVRVLAPLMPALQLLPFLSYALIFFLFLRRGSWRKAGWTRKFPWIYLWLGVSAGIVTTLLSYAIFYAVSGPASSNFYVEVAHLFPDRSVTSLITVTIMMMTLSPFTEELFFRGVMQTSLRQKFSLWPTLLAINVPWGIFHIGQFGMHVSNGIIFLNMPLIAGMVLYIAICGCIVGLLFERSGSLLPSMIQHSTGNLVMSRLAFTFLL